MATSNFLKRECDRLVLMTSSIHAIASVFLEVAP